MSTSGFIVDYLHLRMTSELMSIKISSVLASKRSDPSFLTSRFIWNAILRCDSVLLYILVAIAFRKRLTKVEDMLYSLTGFEGPREGNGMGIKAVSGYRGRTAIQRYGRLYGFRKINVRGL